MYRMRKHSDQKIKEVRELRLKGTSITEIMRLTGLAKTTVWHHVHKITISPTARRKINSNQGGSRRRKEAALVKAKDAVRKLLLSENREITVIVGMLYWAEGSKRELVFTNTDVEMIQLYLYFLRRVLKIKESDLHLLIRIADPIRPTVALKFWSRNTKTKSSQIKINHDNIHNKTKTTHGICRVNLRKNSYYLKQMQCIIEAVKVEYAPIV